MDASKRIDKEIADLADWRVGFLAKIRSAIRAADPQVVEEWKGGSMLEPRWITMRGQRP